MLGAGKYDDIATAAVQASRARDGVMLIVFNGYAGHGFSAQLSPEAMERTPKILRDVADQIDRDLQALKNQPGQLAPTEPVEVRPPLADGAKPVTRTPTKGN